MTSEQATPTTHATVKLARVWCECVIVIFIRVAAPAAVVCVLLRYTSGWCSAGLPALFTYALSIRVVSCRAVCWRALSVWLGRG